LQSSKQLKSPETKGNGGISLSLSQIRINQKEARVSNPLAFNPLRYNSGDGQKSLAVIMANQKKWAKHKKSQAEAMIEHPDFKAMSRRLTTK
jgi:hypothetical protein